MLVSPWSWTPVLFGLRLLEIDGTGLNGFDSVCQGHLLLQKVTHAEPMAAYVISSGNPSKPIKASLLQLPSGVLPLKLKKKKTNTGQRKKNKTPRWRGLDFGFGGEHNRLSWNEDSGQGLGGSFARREKTPKTHKKRTETSHVSGLAPGDGGGDRRESGPGAQRRFVFLQGLGELSESARKVTAPRFLDMLFWLY